MITQYNAERGAVSLPSPTLYRETCYPRGKRDTSRQEVARQREVLFWDTSLLMHDQGNQNPSLCLEEKRKCTRIEQRSQIALEVPHRFDAETAKARRAGYFHRSHAQPPISRRAAGRTFPGNSTESTQQLKFLPRCPAAFRVGFASGLFIASLRGYPVTLVWRAMRREI
jgi:hypothetical protein